MCYHLLFLKILVREIIYSTHRAIELALIFWGSFDPLCLQINEAPTKFFDVVLFLIWSEFIAYDNATSIGSDHNLQLPFLLQAVPTASLPFPPLGTQRRNLQLKEKNMVRVFFWYLLGAKANATWVRVDGVDGLALWALHIHEERVWCLNKFLQFVHFLLIGWVIIKKIDLHCLFQIKC